MENATNMPNGLEPELELEDLTQMFAEASLGTFDATPSLRLTDA